MLRTTTITRSRSPENHKPEEMTYNEDNNQSHTYSRNLLLDYVYQTI